MTLISPACRDALQAWLDAKQALDGASANTISAYTGDVTEFLAFMTTHRGGPQGLGALVDGTMDRWFSKSFRATPELELWRNMFLRQPVEGWTGCAAAISGCDGPSRAVNRSPGVGGGVGLIDARFQFGEVRYCTSAHRGGGIYARDSWIQDAIVEDNQAIEGGGVFVTGSGGGQTDLRSLTVTGNTATETGGGVFALGSTVWIATTVDGNTAATRGGGLYTSLATAHDISDSTFDTNAAVTGGGAFHCFWGHTGGINE